MSMEIIGPEPAFAAKEKPELEWQVVEHYALEMINDPRLSDEEKREYLWYLEAFGDDVVIRKHIPSDDRLATATEILSSAQAKANPID